MPPASTRSGTRAAVVGGHCTRTLGALAPDRSFSTISRCLVAKRELQKELEQVELAHPSAGRKEVARDGDAVKRDGDAVKDRNTIRVV